MMMLPTVDLERFRERLIGFKPRTDACPRALALYSAAIAIADETILGDALDAGCRVGLQRDSFYEIVLQSYLFLGFPRMLTAAEDLDRRLQAPPFDGALRKIDADEAEEWFSRGLQVCRRVYGDNYGPLKERVESFAPEVFRWMVIEGYGKVLSRPRLGIIDRELAIVACLMVENRQKQLFSHIRGAVNVGATPELVRQVVDDIGEAVNDGYRTSLAIINKLGLN